MSEDGESTRGHRSNTTRVIRHASAEKKTGQLKATELLRNDARDVISDMVGLGDTTREVCLSIINTLQDDTTVEMAHAISLVVNQTKRKNIRTGIVIGNREIINTFDGLAEIDSTDERKRAVLFLLISNLANREDEKAEIAMNQSSLAADVLFKRSIEKGAAAMIDTPEGKKRFSFVMAVEHIGEFAKHVLGEEEASQITDLFKLIAENNVMALRLMQKEYSMDEAIAARVGTVGLYYYLLSKVMFHDNERLKSKFVSGRMALQFYDDMGDIRQDMKTQPNPFVAAVRSGVGTADTWKTIQDLDYYTHTFRLPNIRWNKRQKDVARDIWSKYLECDFAWARETMETVSF